MACPPAEFAFRPRGSFSLWRLLLKDLFIGKIALERNSTRLLHDVSSFYLHASRRDTLGVSTHHFVVGFLRRSILQNHALKCFADDLVEQDATQGIVR
jgi:hypothetical protein